MGLLMYEFYARLRRIIWQRQVVAGNAWVDLTIIRRRMCEQLNLSYSQFGILLALVVERANSSPPQGKYTQKILLSNELPQGFNTQLYQRPTPIIVRGESIWTIKLKR